MAELFDATKAKELLEDGFGKAQDLLKDTKKVDEVLDQLQEKLKEVPTVGGVLSNIPLMISMVKSYITQEYAEVSPKVIVTMLSAFIYLIKKKDIIPDNIPVIGQLDDIAVVGLALTFVEPELKAYELWRDNKDTAENLIKEVGEENQG